LTHRIGANGRVSYLFLWSAVLLCAVSVVGCAEEKSSSSPATATPSQSQYSSSPEHSVIVDFYYGSRDLQRLFDLEDELDRAITSAGVGEYDGNEIAVDGGDASLYMYGPDADRLFAVVRPILETTDFTRGARAHLRYGPPDADVREKTVVIGK